MKFKAGDTVTISAGKDKGKKGKIIKVFPVAQKVTVEKVNLYKKHLGPRQTGGKGQIIQKERPLPTANIVLVCKKCNQATRIGYLVDKAGNKQRICKKCKAPITQTSKK